MKVIGDAASYELCYTVNMCKSRTEDSAYPTADLGSQLLLVMQSDSHLGF